MAQGFCPDDFWVSSLSSKTRSYSIETQENSSNFLTMYNQVVEDNKKNKITVIELIKSCLIAQVLINV